MTVLKSGSPLALIDSVMVVRLTRKLAEFVDDIDLRSYRVGQNIDLPWREALILIAEGWAEMIERRRHPREFARASAQAS